MNQQAFNTFYDQTHTMLFRYLVRLCGDQTLGEDILQESYLQFLEKPPRHPEFPAQKSYLYTVATRKLIDHFRMQERKEQTVKWVGEWFEETVQPESREAIRENLSTCLDHLSPHDRALLWLAYVEGYDHREIARVMNLKSASIRVLLFRARQRLRTLFEKQTKQSS